MDLNNLILILLLIGFNILFYKRFLLILNKYNPSLLIDDQLKKPQAFHKESVTRGGGLASIIPLVIFFYRHEKFSPFLVLFITTIILFIIILLFRYLYFGAFFPQPVEAKIGWYSIQKINSGGYIL